MLGSLVPSLVPGVPSPRSAPAIVLFAVGLALYGALAVRAMNTFLLTRRAADFAVVLGIVLLAAALYGALMLTFMDLGWWLGHIFEMLGIVARRRLARATTSAAAAARARSSATSVPPSSSRRRRRSSVHASAR